MSIFKAYDIRGVYGKDITEEVALNIGKSLGTLLKGRGTVCLGYDTRPSSVPLYKSFIRGLLSTGCKVIALGLVTNPMTYFFARKNKIFGCYVTASHNPSNWNGFKMMGPDGVSFTEKKDMLENIFLSRDFTSGKGRIVREKFPMKDYETLIKRRFGKACCKVVVDFLGGAGIKNSRILNEGCSKVKCLHKKSNAALYGFHMLEPWGELLDSAKEAVKKEKAAFGVAYDCDADRSIFISPGGEYVDPSLMVGLFAKYALEKKGGKIIATFDCASETEKMVKDMGGELLWSRIGHSFIEKRLLEEAALFGGEDSSHFFFGDFYPFSDGLLSTLKLCEIISISGKGFDELLKEIKFRPIKKIYIDAKTDERKNEAIEKIRKIHPGSLDISDGFKIFLGDGEWVIIRGSQTLPEINLCIEANNPERMNDLTKKYSEIIRAQL